MSRPTIDFLRYLFRLRPARTSVTAAEREFLVGLAHGRHSIVEVGVFEGATSAALAEAIEPRGHLWLVDPYIRGTRPERLLRFSFTAWIATRTVRPWKDRATFVRCSSITAARELVLARPADLVFIDADHSYSAVRGDFLAWILRLAPDGVVAFHDSRCCSTRPDLVPTTGPVRLVDEILRGEYGDWGLVGTAESVAAVARRGIHDVELRPGGDAKPVP